MEDTVREQLTDTARKLTNSDSKPEMLTFAPHKTGEPMKTVSALQVTVAYVLGRLAVSDCTVGLCATCSLMEPAHGGSLPHLKLIC